MLSSSSHACRSCIAGALVAGKEAKDLVGAATQTRSGVTLAQFKQHFFHAHAHAGALVAGKEVDELVGAATLQIRGDVAARLMRGERCTLPAVLGSGTSEDAGGVKVGG